MRQRNIAARGAVVMAVLSALAAGTAQAQSAVTIYGRIDLGVQYTSKTPNGGGDVTELYNGGIRPSILGFKGSEDLGGGLTALFNLESHFSGDTGVTTSRFWRRQANVGLRGGFGTVLLGVQYSPAVLALLNTDPRAIKEQMSGLYPFALNQVGGSPSNDLGIFITNALSYSNTLGPVDFGVAYSFGEQGDKSSAGSIWSGGATFSGPNDLKVAGFYQQVKNDGSGLLGSDRASRQYGLGAGLPLGPATFRLQYIGATVHDAATAEKVSDTNIWGAGVDLAWAGNNNATLAYYYAKNKAFDDDRTDTLILSNDYSLSKRTILYAQVAVIRAKDGATGFTSAVANAVVPDKTNSVFGVGISHNF